MSISKDVISTFINWLERGVKVENHHVIQKKLLKETLSYIQNNINNIEIINQAFISQVNQLILGEKLNINDFGFKKNFRTILTSKLNNDINDLQRDDDIINFFMEIFILNDKNQNFKLNISEKSQTLIKINIKKLQETASWHGTRSEINAAQVISKLSFYSLNMGILEKDYIESILKKMIESISPYQWFSPSSEIYGKSFFLRSLIFLCIADPKHYFYDYLKNVCEHLLRRMEIKRERTILSTNDNFHLSTCLLEQLRLNKFVLESGVFFNDLRFLNAVMKSNDRIYNIMSKIKISSKPTLNNISNISIALHYNDNLCLQEKLYGSLK